MNVGLYLFLCNSQIEKNIKKIKTPEIPKRKLVMNNCTGLNNVMLTAMIKYNTNRKMRVCILLSML
jgi:hypothetical protein